MTPEKWDRLMRQAHNHAALWGGRVRVRSYKLPAWTPGPPGGRWAYTWDCPDDCPCDAESF
jgi:hypothetical protein